MTPESATEKQIERYRHMGCEERLTIACRLHELAREMARIGIRHQHPNATEVEIARLLRQRMELARTL